MAKKLEKIFLFLSITGILSLILFSNLTQSYQTATISEIKKSENLVTIKIQNSSTELILFDNPNINLQAGNKIKFAGRKDIYKNQEQIIIDKLETI